MGLSSSLYSAVTGLKNHQTRLDNIGNNLANVNTVGYKRSVLQFADIFSQTIRYGSAPGATYGGINPSQIGRGMQVASVTPDFGQGGLDSTGKPSDLAIEGEGFFKVMFAGDTRYTRDGAFTLGQGNDLQNAFGWRVQGWNADINGIIDTNGATEDIIIPVGEMRLSRQTSTVTYTGNVNSDGAVATANTAATDSNNTYRSVELWANAANTIPATAATLLSSVYSGLNTLMFSAPVGAADTITVNAVKGERQISTPVSYTAATTLGDFMTNVQDALGINTAEVGTGVTLLAGAGATGGNVVRVAGNRGELNGISNFSFRHSAATTDVFTLTAAANGESAVNTMAVYDSLGNQHMVTLTLAMVNRTDSATTWRWYADCPDDSDLNLAVGTGTITFDDHGQFELDSGGLISIDLSSLGVINPLVVDPDFGLLTQFATATGSEVNLKLQDGAAMGVLTSYSIGEDGTITGLFSNGMNQDLGRLCVTRFSNNNGLVRSAMNLWAAGVNSGLPQDGEAIVSGRGTIRAGSLESSNVDIAAEFTDMIVTQRGYQANARTITVSDQMLQELTNLVR